MSKRITPEELPRVLQTLRDGAARAQCDALRRLCPCRSRCYEPQVWLSILHMWANTHDEQVRHQAQHAIDTLRDNLRHSEPARELVRVLAERHQLSLPELDVRQTKMQEARRLDSRATLDLLEALRGTDTTAQCAALHALCPCRNRRYDKEVWIEIFRLFRTTTHSRVRDDAQHAIDTLQNRTRTDPRSQELVRKLAPFDPRARELSRRIPTYREPMADAQSTLVVPNWERTPRSRRNRRR